MHVIDGQARRITASSLICYSLTINNILNIIVLIILAGVTISLILGDNGIITKAKEAKNAQANAEAYEDAQMDSFESTINDVWANTFAD